MLTGLEKVAVGFETLSLLGESEEYSYYPPCEALLMEV